MIYRFIRDSNRFASPRTIALVVLLVCEGLTLGLVFGAGSVRGLHGGWYVGLLALMPRTVQLLANIGAAGLIFAARPRTPSFHPVDLPPATSTSAPFILLHAGGFIGLVAATHVLCNRADWFERQPAAWTCAWFAACVLTLFAWCLAMGSIEHFIHYARKHWRAALLIVVVGTIAWGSGRVTLNLWNSLQTGTLMGAYAIVRLLEPTAVVNTSRFLIGAGHFTVEVGPNCSGYEGIGLMWTFLLAHFWIYRRRFWLPGALLLLPAATLTVWGANLLRIAVLVLVGAHYSPELAMGGFHSYLGILLFAGLALLFGWIAHHSAAVRHDLPEKCQTEDPAPYLMPFIAMIGAALVTALWAKDGLYGVRLAIVAPVIWCYRKQIQSSIALPGRWAFGIGSLVFLLWIAIIGFHSPNSHAAGSQGTPGWAWIGIRLIGSVLAAPLVEELAFRAYLMRRLTSASFATISLKHTSMVAVLISSACFALTHEHWLAAFAAGAGYAFLARRTGRLSDAIVAHSMTNGFLSIFVLSHHAWALWA